MHPTLIARLQAGNQGGAPGLEGPIGASQKVLLPG